MIWSCGWSFSIQKKIRHFHQQSYLQEAHPHNLLRLTQDWNWWLLPLNQHRLVISFHTRGAESFHPEHKGVHCFSNWYGDPSIAWPKPTPFPMYHQQEQHSKHSRIAPKIKPRPRGCPHPQRSCKVLHSKHDESRCMQLFPTPTGEIAHCFRLSVQGFSSIRYSTHFHAHLTLLFSLSFPNQDRKSLPESYLLDYIAGGWYFGANKYNSQWRVYFWAVVRVSLFSLANRNLISQWNWTRFRCTPVRFIGNCLTWIFRHWLQQLWYLLMVGKWSRFWNFALASLY